MSDVGRILRQARQELLDLSAGRPLLDTPRHRARAKTVEVVGARSETVFRHLVDDGKGLSFRPRPEPHEIEAEAGSAEDLLATLAPPAETGCGEGGLQHQEPWHNLWLQTELGPERLQGRLLRLHHDARSQYEERGVGALYLALGFLEWYESAVAQQPCHAPLILVPVRLERGSAVERFRLWFADEEIATNLALADRLRDDFALSLPEIDPTERLEPAAYLRLVADAVRTEARFRVHADDVVLGLFSFARLLTYRDLDPAAWPAEMALEQRPLLRALLGEGFPADAEIALDERSLDELLPPRDALHVLDADGAQAIALATARAGHSLLIQGPPGTGKSQTIANLVAAAVHDGKTVLFVAQKMAALEVVKRRLDQIGLGELCLELHSRCASRRELLEEFERTLQLGAPRADDPADCFEELAAARARLDDYAQGLHRPAGGAGVTPFEAIGRLAELRGRGTPPCPVKLPGASHWSRAELRARRGQVSALAQRVAELGIPAGHPWRGIGLQALAPGDQQAIEQAVAALHVQLATLLKAVGKLEEWLGTRPVAQTREQLARVIDAAASLARLPAEADVLALRAEVWEHEVEAIQNLVAAGTIFGIARNDLRRVVKDAAWSLDLTATRQALAGHGALWWRWFSCAWRRSRTTLRALARGAPPTALAEQLALLDRLIDAQAIGRQILAGDALGRAAFGGLWAGERSDWGKLGAVLAWRRDPAASTLMPCLLHLLAESGERRPPIMLAAHSRRLLDAVEAGWSALVARLQLDSSEAFGEPRIESLALTRVLERLASWAAQPAGLASWLDYGAQKRRA
ncbi:MAG TPA: DUF4011 domain-containing protein, partial [Geminicoccaceae bacterium]|nr:DUF4011 domain-containing protein [Geminicoccaceae bacterium]